MPSDAIAVLKNDHRIVEDLFKRFEKSGERAVKTRQTLVGNIIGELVAHTYIEE